ncbi:phage holin family protein [Micromonosporaceae bacterium B7E4]
MSEDDPTLEPATRDTAPADRLAQDIAALARRETARMRGDLAESVRRAGLGAALLAGGGIAAVLGLGSASAAALWLLDARLPPRRAVAVLAAGYLGTAAFLTLVGLVRLRSAGGRTSRLTAELRGVMAGVRAGRG